MTLLWKRKIEVLDPLREHIPRIAHNAMTQCKYRELESANPPRRHSPASGAVGATQGTDLSKSKDRVVGAFAQRIFTS